MQNICKIFVLEGAFIVTLIRTESFQTSLTFGKEKKKVPQSSVPLKFGITKLNYMIRVCDKKKNNKILFINLLWGDRRIFEKCNLPSTAEYPFPGNYKNGVLMKDS